MKKILISGRAKYVIDFETMTCDCFDMANGLKFDRIELKVYRGKIIVNQTNMRWDYWKSAQPLYEEYLADKILLEEK